MTESWTTLKVLDWTTARFERAAIESARLEAQLLLAHVLRCDRMSLYTSFEKPLAPEELSGYRALIERRLAGECVAYLLGSKEFWSREFRVTPDVLVPRGDTETVISAVLDRAADSPEGMLVDVGTGSGAIAVTIACELTERHVLAIDVSPEALAVARGNAEKHGVEGRVRFELGDLLGEVRERAAFIIANLPYVESAEIDGLAAEVRGEPRLALDGGTDGLDLITRLVAQAPDRLTPGGWLVLEHGHDQGQAVRKLLMGPGEFQGVETVEDLAGRDRVTLGKRTSA